MEFRRFDRLLPKSLRARRILRSERVLNATCGEWELVYPSSSQIGRALAGGEGWEPTLATVVDLMLPLDESPLIADVGSNFGSSLAQMMSVRPKAKYVCFEPADRFRELLIRNVRRNGWRNVVVESRLIGATTNQTVPLFANTTSASVAEHDYGGHVFLDATDHQVETLDDYFASAPRVDMIKSDTDGFDCDVLMGAEGVLREHAPVLYFELAPFLLTRVGRDPQVLLNGLEALGYRQFLALSQAGDSLLLTGNASEMVNLAHDRKYIDVLTVARPAQTALLPKVAAATSSV